MTNKAMKKKVNNLESKKKFLGHEIHKLLNKTITRALAHKEYTQLVLLIGGVFDLISPPVKKKK